PPETILSHTFFMRQPEDFYKFYRDKILMKGTEKRPEPNAAHRKLAELEEKGKLTAVVTQNIDGLHQAAGSKTVYELHGSILRNYCMKCGKAFDLDYMMESEDPVPKCDKCGGTIKPDVVLYEEGLDQMTIQKSIEAISEADVLIIGGTSLVVYPAAGLIDYFRGKKLVLINKGATSRDSSADLVITESIGEVLGAIKVN
ncbi:MAG: NAD-dependent protein deacylase, partial [Lachnospiraceae bacterium]|nr:NAD-dependent protein deacylase [Lachnospiraceae bacterium]